MEVGRVKLTHAGRIPGEVIMTELQELKAAVQEAAEANRVLARLMDQAGGEAAEWLDDHTMTGGLFTQGQAFDRVTAALEKLATK
jgi:hypothetical protein